MLLTVPRGAITRVAAQPGTRFLLDVPAGHGGDGAYTQAMSYPNGAIYAEVPSNEFLTPPLTAAQQTRLADLGWSGPNTDTPNHWQEWPIGADPSSIAKALVETLHAVYGVTDGEFSLSPAALAPR